MQTQDSRGVTYDVSTVRAGRRHAKLTAVGAGSSQIIERLSPRPVDVKRLGRRNMSKAAKRARAKLDLIVNHREKALAL